ncbi:hypothetical protein [Pseudomonas graminis]
MIDPDNGTPYIPTLHYFLGGFDIYDREETLGEELSSYNPDIQSDRHELIKRYFLHRHSNSSYREKYLLFTCLEKALSEKEYNFQAIFEDDPEEYSSLPAYWDKMKNPRAFFEDIYLIIVDEWRSEISKASKEDPNDW